MHTWIFTFGFGHTHPETGEPLKNCYTRIAAEDSEAARAEMVRRFGLKWAFQYKTPDDAGVDRFGLREVS